MLLVVVAFVGWEDVVLRCVARREKGLVVLCNPTVTPCYALPLVQTRESCCDVIEPHLGPDGVVVSCLDFAMDGARRHIMTASRGRLVVSFFSLLARGISNVVRYNDSHPGFPLDGPVIERYMDKWMVTSLLWGFGGSLDLAGRRDLCAHIASKHPVTLPAVPNTAAARAAATDAVTVMDCFVDVQNGHWRLWQELVPVTDVDSHKVLETDAVIPTVDTVRHVVRRCR